MKYNIDKGVKKGASVKRLFILYFSLVYFLYYQCFLNYSLNCLVLKLLLEQFYAH